MTKTERLLRDLIAIPSINPSLVPAGDVRAGERRVGEFVAEVARKAGLDVERREVAPGRFNILARLAPAGRVRRRIVLAPHLDTVGGEEEALYSPRAKGNRLYGRGACDTKGSVAAMLGAVLDVSGIGRGETEIVFAGLVDEEAAQAGSRRLIREGFKADLAIVGEPTRLQVVTSHKGVAWLKLRTRGKAAHGARPELGRNAVHEMARVVEVLETEYAARLKRRRQHRLLGWGTVNVGAIRGGRQPNIVPDDCGILVDRRMVPGETGPGVRKEIAELLVRRQLRASIVTTQASPCWPLETDPELPLVRQFLGVAGQAAPAGVDYFSDAAVLAAGGVPSVVFGPGDIAQAHRPDEWVSLPQLERARKLLARFLASLS